MKVAIIGQGIGLKQNHISHAVGLSNFSVTEVVGRRGQLPADEKIQQWSEEAQIPFSLGFLKMNPDQCASAILLWDGSSSAITHLILPFKNAGKPVFLYDFKKGEGRFV